MSLATSLNLANLPDEPKPKAAGNLSLRLAARLYKKDPNRKRPEARFRLNGVPICTPGNLSTFSAAAKAGKTAATGALVASTYAAPGSDCLGFASANPHGHAVIIFDTEQTPGDHADAFERSERRAQVATAPPWVRSYCLTGFSAHEIRHAIRLALEDAKKMFGAIHSFLLDGVADVCLDVNDAAEANDLVTELQGLAIEFDCPLLCVIHVNPSSKDHKTRGHLGSQLERKSECNFKLERTEEATVLFADKNRHAPIPKDEGACFAWNDEAGMHTSIATRESANDRRSREELTALVEQIFSERREMRYGDLLAAVENHTGKSPKTAERRIALMTRLKIIKKDAANLYAQAVTVTPANHRQTTVNGGITVTPSPYIYRDDGRDGEKETL